MECSAPHEWPLESLTSTGNPARRPSFGRSGRRGLLRRSPRNPSAHDERDGPRSPLESPASRTLALDFRTQGAWNGNPQGKGASGKSARIIPGTMIVSAAIMTRRAALRAPLRVRWRPEPPAPSSDGDGSDSGETAGQSIPGHATAFRSPAIRSSRRCGC
jgi:hypothetical protein